MGTVGTSVYITVTNKSDGINSSFPYRPEPWLYLQGEDGGDGLVVADCVLHVTAVEVLCDSSAASEP